jgi:hypothetical protein
MVGTATDLTREVIACPRDLGDPSAQVRQGDQTVGVLRVVALMVSAPLLAMPAAAMASSAHPSSRSAAALSPDATGPRSGTDTLRAPARVRLLAVRVSWGAAHPAYPSTRSVRRDLDTTSAYYDRVSRGRETLRYRLTPWIHVAASADTMCNHLRAAARLTTAALVRAGYRPSRYNRLMLFTEQCDAAVSAAEQPGRTSWIRFRNPGSATLIHELGHNLGLGHADGLVCRADGRRVSLGGECHSVEYGDSWDAMGHSRASFSVPVLRRLGWAGRVTTVTGDGTFPLADVEHPGDDVQALRIPVGHGTTYWVEYQPEHLAVVGRTRPGVTIRRQVGDGPVVLLDAAPGNPTALPFPDADLTNAALPAGSSFTGPEDVRITTAATGRGAQVEVSFGRAAAAPTTPVVDYAARLGDGRYAVRWERPADNGQIVLGYRVTSVASGESVYVPSTGGVRTSLVLPGDGAPTEDPAFTVEAVNQVGWSGAATVEGRSYAPQVTVTSPQRGARVRGGFDVSLSAAPDEVTGSEPVRAWAALDGVACTSAQGPGPYTLRCPRGGAGHATVTVHVANADGAQTDVSVPVRVSGRR